MRMKTIVIGLLSLGAFAASVQPVRAFLCWRHCCCKYSTYICCRPYNAFTPTCYGSITCNGCCPMQFSNGGPFCPPPLPPPPRRRPPVVASHFCRAHFGHPHFVPSPETP